jgi:hypothetical protein
MEASSSGHFVIQSILSSHTSIAILKDNNNIYNAYKDNIYKDNNNIYNACRKPHISTKNAYTLSNECLEVLAMPKILLGLFPSNYESRLE